MKQRASYRQGLSYGALSFVVVSTVGVASGVLIARIYGVAVVGQFALAMAPALVLSMLSSAREQIALVRELALQPVRSPRVTGLFAAVMAFSFVLTVAVAVLVLLGAYFVLRGPVHQPGLFLPALVLVASYVALENTSWNLDMVFSAYRAGPELFWVRFSQATGYTVFAIAFGLIRNDVWGLTYAWTLAAAVCTGQRLILVSRFMPARIARSEIRKGFDSLPEMIRFGLKTTPGAIADGVSNEVGTWVLGIVASTAAVGAFNRAWLLGRRFVDLQHRVAEILFPTILERRAARDFDGADRVVVDSMRYSTMFLLLPAAVGGGASTAVMSVYGPGFGRASAALGLLLLVPPLAVIGSIQSHMLLAVDRPVASSVSSVGRMVVTVAVCVVLGILFGVSGAALAVLVGYVAEVGWKAYLVKGQLARPVLSLWPLRQWAGLVLAFGAAFVCSRLVSEELFGAAGLLLGLTAGTVVYLAVLFVGGDLSARDRERLTSASVRLRMGYRGLVGRRTVSEAPVGEAE